MNQPPDFEPEALGHLDSVYRVALWLCGNPTEAKDLVQDTYERALRARAGFVRTNMRAWLLTILRHRFLNLRRRRRIVEEVALEDTEMPPGPVPDVPAGVVRRERLAREAVDDHIRVVLRQRTGATGPSDARALQALMQPVLDYRVPLPGGGTARFQLAGGRPSYINGQPVACFYYRDAGTYASLFVVPLARLGKAADHFSTATEVVERPAHRMAYWRQDQYAYILVSEAPAADLVPLAVTLQQS